MERLLSVLDGDAKKAVNAIGYSGLFYAVALKTLKRDFGNEIVVSHLKLNSVLEKPQINQSDRAALRQYHQQLKTVNTWLISMGYESSLYSTENLAKAVKRLPHSLRTQFYKNWKEKFDCNSKNSLIDFEQWLDGKTKEFLTLLLH